MVAKFTRKNILIHWLSDFIWEASAESWLNWQPSARLLKILIPTETWLSFTTLLKWEILSDPFTSCRPVCYARAALLPNRTTRCFLSCSGWRSRLINAHLLLLFCSLDSLSLQGYSSSLLNPRPLLTQTLGFWVSAQFLPFVYEALQSFILIPWTSHGPL